MIVIKRLDNRDTSHRGILSKRPKLSTAVTISVGSVAAVEIEPPTLPITVLTTPPQMANMAVINSMQLPTASFAKINLIK